MTIRVFLTLFDVVVSQAKAPYCKHCLGNDISSMGISELIPFRIVELKQGSITIDDVNCRSIGLDVLRRQLAVIPQDSVLL